MSDCVSRYKIAQWKVGELDPAEGQALEEHINHCADCAQVVAALESHTETCHNRRESHLRQIKQRLESEREPHAARESRPLFFRFSFQLVGAMALVVVALGLTWGLGDWEKRREQAQGIKYKGTVALALQAVRNAHRFEVQPGTELYDGDSIEFSVTTSQAGILSVFYRDAANKLIPLNPQLTQGADLSAVRVGRAGQHTLPGRFVLQNKRRIVGLGVLFSPQVFDVEEIYRKIEQASVHAPTAIESPFTPAVRQKLIPIVGYYQAIQVQ